MITIFRTEDRKLITSIVVHPKVYPGIIDDFSPHPDYFDPPIDESILYLVAQDHEPDYEYLGLWTLIPENGICKKVHTCLLPVSYGALSREAAAAMLLWVWKNTNCERIITDIPSYNRIALKYAIDCGLVQYGLNPRSYMKNGILYDQILLGISRPE